MTIQRARPIVLTFPCPYVFSIHAPAPSKAQFASRPHFGNFVSAAIHGTKVDASAAKTSHQYDVATDLAKSFVKGQPGGPKTHTYLLYGADVNHDTMPYWSFSIAVSKPK